MATGFHGSRSRPDPIPVELSFKVDRSEAPAAERDWHRWLDGQGIGRDGDPRPKTEQALEHLAARL